MGWMIVRMILWISFCILPGAFALWGGWFAWKRLSGRGVPRT